MVAEKEYIIERNKKTEALNVSVFYSYPFVYHSKLFPSD